MATDQRQSTQQDVREYFANQGVTQGTAVHLLLGFVDEMGDTSSLMTYLRERMGVEE